MSDWTDGYRAAWLDFITIARSRGLLTSADCQQLANDLIGDALVIERERHNRLRQHRLNAQHEAELPLEPKP